MKFKMNDRDWEIKETSQKHLKEIDDCVNEQGSIYGLTCYESQTIYLWEDIIFEKKRQTLMHELMHCYIDCYVSFQAVNYNEEILCHISANSHDIIHKIVEDYFKAKKE